MKKVASLFFGVCICVWAWAALAYQVPAAARAVVDAGVAETGPTDAQGQPPPAPSPPPPPVAPLPTPAPDDDGFPTKTFGSLVLKMPPSLADGTHVHGYSFHRFQIFNKDKSARTIRIRLTGKDADGFHLKEVSQTRRVPAGGRVWFQLRYPRLTFAGRFVEVWKDGEQVGQTKLNEAYPALYSQNFSQIQVLRGRRMTRLMSRQLRRGLQMMKRYNLGTRARVLRQHRYKVYRHRYRRHWRWMYRRRRWRLHGGTAPKPPPAPKLSSEVSKLLKLPLQSFLTKSFVWHRAGVSAHYWPTQWLAYSRFDGIIIKPTEWSNLREGARTALYRYAEAGGTLVFSGRWQAPSTWRHTKRSNATWRFYPRGFGEVLVYQSDISLGTRNDASTLLPLYKSFSRSFIPWREVLAPQEANSVFSVVGELKIPARGIFALMFLFVVLIGPLNFWVLGRFERRLWTLWTVPLIAFVTCAMLFLYASFSEGWGGHARLDCITLLDQQGKRATTLGWMGFYKPLTPSNGLRFDPSTELSPQLRNDGRANRGLVMDLSKAQELRKGWSMSRLPVHFRFRRVERRQERLVVKRNGDKITVLNGLGATITRLWVLDAKGGYFVGANIASGARKTLALAPPESDYDTIPLRNVYLGKWVRSRALMMKVPWRYLQYGSYIAELKTSPFAEPAVKNSAYIRTKSAVYGILGAPDGS